MSLYNQKIFEERPASGFDGFFDWDWTKGCLGANFITPMDIDGITERKGHFLIFETKGVGNPIPAGQFYTLQALYRLGCFTVVFCDKVNPPTQMSVWTEPGFLDMKGLTMPCEEKVIIDGDRQKKVYCPEYLQLKDTPDRARNFVTKWFQFADGGINEKA